MLAPLEVRPQSLSAAPILEPEDRAERRVALAGSDQRVEPGRQVRVPVRERMPVAIQPDRHGGVPGPGRDLLRVRPAAFYNATAVHRSAGGQVAEWLRDLK
jgi:hypothetical protein